MNPRHLLHTTPLIFEQGSPGRTGASLPRQDVPDRDPAADWGKELARAVPAHLPEVSEVEVTRHYTRLSRWNYAIDIGLYPLGSCTMKYNPKINEQAARIPGFAALHPYQPEETLQGALAPHVRAGAGAVRDRRDVARHAAAGGRRARRAHRADAHPRG